MIKERGWKDDVAERIGRGREGMPSGVEGLFEELIDDVKVLPHFTLRKDAYRSSWARAQTCPARTSAENGIRPFTLRDSQ